MILVPQRVLDRLYPTLSPEETRALNDAQHSLYNGRVLLDETKLGPDLYQRIRWLLGHKEEK